MKSNTTIYPLLESHHTHEYRGIFSIKTVDIVIPFYNESGNIFKAHENVQKLENLFNIQCYIYVNNGSTDKTLEELKCLEQKHARVRVLSVKENIGYGNGFKEGFKASKADFIITNHADQQFDAYRFFSGISEDLSKLKKGSSIFSIRKGRPRTATFFTAILRYTLSLKVGSRLKDFNGQPKLIDRSSISIPIDDFPDNFSFDLMLYIFSGEKLYFPILEQSREIGKSSWNHDMISKLNLFRSYLKSARDIRTILRQSKV